MSLVIKRGIIVGLGLMLQICLFLFVYLFLGSYSTLLTVFYHILGIGIVLWLLKNSRSYANDLPWIIIILLFPVVGTLLYLVIGQNMRMSRLLKKIKASEQNASKYLVQDEKVRKSTKDSGKIRYITDYLGYPATENNDVEYYPLGELAFAEMLKELEKAEKFIFFEYFIVDHGKMWGSILEILKKKAEQGVDVRVMYDDLGSMSTMKPSYPKELEKFGIKCVVFNKLSPLAGVIMNNRDHRKILVIDGRVAFSGGINIADEYINEKEKYGHWKDNGIKIVGDGVWNFTVMFLSLWNALEKTDRDFDEFRYKFEKTESKGVVVPYGETPLDNEVAGQNIYLNIINQANDYVYIFTPYLIIDSDMSNALVLAAKRGVDVRIVIPGVPDKKLVYTVSESYVGPLVKGGVKVYRYTPGFVHAKVFVSDDKIATVGTLNLDYRSLYLHFECGVYMEGVKCIGKIKKDLEETIERSKVISEREAKASLPKGAFQAFLRLVAPLM